MSKYEEFQHLFVEDGDTHQLQANACFDAIDELTYQLIEYSDWYPDDVEYITLGQPILPGKPKQMMRIKRTGRNRDRIREIASWMNNGWSLGIRFRLRPHVSVSFQPREVMFVLPILVNNSTSEEVTVQIEPEGTVYYPENFNSLVELTFQRIQTILELGVQRLISKSHRPEELHDLGFVLDSENLEELGIEINGRRAIQPSHQTQTGDRPSEPEIGTGNSMPPSTIESSTPMVKEETSDLAIQSSETAGSPSTTNSTKKTGRSRKTK